MAHTRRNAGFTLLEILVAVSLFALLGLGGYQLLDSIIHVKKATDETGHTLLRLQRTVQQLSLDITQAVPRAVRVGSQSRLPALYGGIGAPQYLLEFTRGGWNNPLGRNRSNLQRVAYRLENGSLQRLYWNELDRPADTEPMVQLMMDRVNAVTVRFLDSRLQWQNYWPLLNNNTETLPRAIEIIMDVNPYGEIRHVIEVPGS